MTTCILGDNVPRKSNYDPDLARKITQYYAEHPEAPAGKSKVPQAITLLAGNTSGSLERIKGNYFEAIKSAVPETIQTSAELQKARVENSHNYHSSGDEFELAYSLIDLTYFTANVPLYGVEKGKPFLLFGGREAFLRLYVPHLDDVYNQINSRKNYILPSADKAWALDEGISSGALNRFDLAELIEFKPHKAWGYFALKTQKSAQLKGAKRELAKLIHGQGNDYFDTLKMLAEKGISETKVLLLTPDYVISRAGNNLVGQTSLLFELSNDSNFEACICDATHSYGLRGVRKK